MASSPLIAGLSGHLFWDTPVENVDVERHRRWLVNRVLEKGTWQDWNRLLQLYGKEGVRDAVKSMRSLEKKAFRFACAVLDIEPSDCRCFTNTRSRAGHWNC